LVLLTPLLIGTSACDGAGDKVVSLATETAASTAQFADQAETAKAMVDCLRDQDVPAVLEMWDDGQGELGFDGGAAWRLCQEQDGMCHGGGGRGMTQVEVDAEQQVLDQLEEAYKGQWAHLPADKRGVSYLLAGGEDYTTAYLKCSENIDYVPPKVPVNPAEELVYKNAIAEASNNWLRCAREHGYPGLADVKAPTADGYDTMPVALLPVTVTPNQLELLLQECPITSFGTTEWPSIAVDAPGYNGREPLRYAATPNARTDELAGELMGVIGNHLPAAPPNVEQAD
jgi:hypothetical protein